MTGIYGALFSGVTALNAQSQNMAAISDNIANVNTIGFKRTVARFSTLVTDTQSRGRYTPGGVQATPFQQIDRQGLIQATTSSTDVAIAGKGFFVVSTQSTQVAGNAANLYTRAGSFATDLKGNLVTPAGYYLQGYKLDTAGNYLTPAGVTTSATDLFSNLQTVNLADRTSVAVPTRNVNLIANLPPTTGTTPTQQTNVTIYDSLGQPQQMELTWTPTALNSWEVTLSFNPTSITAPTTAFTVVFNNAGQLTQVGTNTTPSASGVLSVSGIDFSAVVGTAAGVAQPMAIDLNLGTIGQGNGLSQVAGGYAINAITQDGVPPAGISGVWIDGDGFVTAVYANGLSNKIYRLAIATFQNPNDLQRRDGNTYSTTAASGDPQLRPANTGASGAISPFSLEGSTVDLAEEFTNMIITQRAYTAATKVITTADEMLNEVVRLKR
ncbi:MAG: flagellar hook protein FlgE [Alphaproteobacteria bacterium]|nr:flagellar hook protein FlgE [Alphaproteobacteria bacterium]